MCPKRAMGGLFVRAENGKQHKFQRINKTMVHPCNAVISSNSKERDGSICIGMKRKDILSEKK